MRRVVGIHGGGDDVGKAHVGDEPAAFVHLQHRFAARLPFGHAHLAGQHAGFHADKRNRFGERERGADLLAVFARLERRGGGDVFGALLRRAALVNRRKAEIARQAARGGAGVHPGQFKRDQRQRQVFRPGNEPALFRVEEGGGDAAFVEVLEQARLSPASIRANCARRRRRAARPARARRRARPGRACASRNGRQSAT